MLFWNKMLKNNIFSFWDTWWECSNNLRALRLGVKTPQFLFWQPRPRNRASFEYENAKVFNIHEQWGCVYTTSLFIRCKQKIIYIYIYIYFSLSLSLSLLYSLRSFSPFSLLPFPSTPLTLCIAGFFCSLFCFSLVNYSLLTVIEIDSCGCHLVGLGQSLVGIWVEFGWSLGAVWVEVWVLFGWLNVLGLLEVYLKLSKVH